MAPMFCPWSQAGGRTLQFGDPGTRRHLRTVFKRMVTSSISTLHSLTAPSLNDDIAAYASWVTLTPSELAVRRVLTAHVKQFLQSQVDGIEIESFGSHEVGLGRPSSDIDVAFYIPSMQKEVGQRGPSAGRPEARAAITKKIRDIETAFEKSNSFQRIRTVVAGRFPLVEAEYGSSGLQFQVVASGAQFQETRISMIQAYCDQWPQFRPLYFTIKAILHSRRLGTPNRGGLGSYPLTIMLLTFFRHRAISRSQDYATTLRGFLLFYNHHNTRHYGLCADPPCTFLKHSADHNPTTITKKAFEQLPALRDRYNLAMVPDDRSPFLLCLQDPLDSTNDLGARAHRIMDIRETFGTLARQMQDWIEHRGSMGDYYSYLVNPAASNEGLTRRRMSRWRFAEEEAASDIGRLFEAIETPDQMHFGFRVRKTNSRPRFGWAETAIGNTESVDDTAGDDPVDGMSGKDVVDGTCNGRQ